MQVAQLLGEAVDHRPSALGQKHPHYDLEIYVMCRSIPFIRHFLSLVAPLGSLATAVHTQAAPMQLEDLTLPGRLRLRWLGQRQSHQHLQSWISGVSRD